MSYQVIKKFDRGFWAKLSDNLTVHDFQEIQ
jgi:hypothetical protein